MNVRFSIKLTTSLIISLLLLSILLGQKVYATESDVGSFGNSNLPNWLNVTVTVSDDGKSFTIDNADNLTWTFQYGANKYNSIHQSGVQIVKDELWLLFNENKDNNPHSIDVSYEQLQSYNVRVTQFYTSKSGDYNVTWIFDGGFRPKILLIANITIAGNYTVNWRTYLYKDFAEEKINYVRFWDEGEEAIVFDYTDVYQSFGNITEIQGVEDWVKGKRFDLIFNVDLDIGLFVLDPSFGFEEVGASRTLVPDGDIRGTIWTAPDDVGIAVSITAYIEPYFVISHPSFVFGLYEVDGIYFTLVDQTEEEDWAPAGAQWHTLNFTSPPALTAGESYHICVYMGEDQYGYDSFMYYNSTAGITNSRHNPEAPYDGTMPATMLEFAQSPVYYSIYCNYTADTIEPTYSDVGTNTTIVENPCLFYTKWTDNVNMSGYIFGTNNTGTWANDTWSEWSPIGTPKWSNITKTLTSTIGAIVQWCIWANDTADNWNNTGIQQFTTIWKGTTPTALHSFCGETGTNYANNTIDENIGTTWLHFVVCYHWIIFDMGETMTIKEIRLYQGTHHWGKDAGLYVYVGDDPADFGDSVWNGTLDAAGWQESGAFEKNGRYIKLVSKSNLSWQFMWEFEAYAIAIDEWHDVAEWNFNLTGKQWFDVSQWSFNLLTMQWNEISQWTFNLTTKTWNDIESWAFNLITKGWNIIEAWAFTLIPTRWNTITKWDFTFAEARYVFPFILIIMAVFIMICCFIGTSPSPTNHQVDPSSSSYATALSGFHHALFEPK